LVFASELKAFLELDGFAPALNEEIVPLIIRHSQGYEAMTDQTVMKGVHKLPGGHSLIMDTQGKIVVSKWLETRNHLLQVPKTYEEQVEQFRHLFFDAVRIRMRSDVAVGTCLSGGIDSSAVSCSMNRLHQGGKHDLHRCPDDWQHAFIATFPGSSIDEKQFADEVVRHIGANPNYWEFDHDRSLSHIIDSVWSMEDIYCGIAVPVWCIYRELRKNKIFVTLDGHGGDELLGGYTWYLDWAMNQVNQNLYNDFHKNLLPAILRNYDRCSMAHGIEVRMPFMDWRLVSFSFGLPASSKMGGGYTKRIIRDAMKGIMPERIRTRINKVGFNSPMIEWYNSKMSAFIDKIVNHQLWVDSPFWDGKKMRDVILAKTRSRSWNHHDWDLSLHVWVLMNIVIWQLLFVERNISEIQL
jgi:asparagine synthetase B (glutamine-hydrolysing)